GCIWRSAGALHPALRTSRCSSLSGHHRAVGAPAPGAKMYWPRSHRGGAPTRTKPLRFGCIWRSAGALHPVLRTSWCSSLPGDHRTVGAPAPGAITCPPRSQRGGAPTRAKLGTSSTSSMSGFDQATKRQPALAPCPTGKKNGSSRISGEGGLDLQNEVIKVAVSVSHAFDHFDLVIDPFKLASMHWPAHSGQDASPVRLQY